MACAFIDGLHGSVIACSSWLSSCRSSEGRSDLWMVGVTADCLALSWSPWGDFSKSCYELIMFYFKLIPIQTHT